MEKNLNIGIIGVGTNSMATASLIKGGASRGATGENPVVVASREADIIIGPIGIVIADALLGEVTPKMVIPDLVKETVEMIKETLDCGR